MACKSKIPVQLSVLGCGTLGSAIVDGIVSQIHPTRSYRLCLTGRREDHILRLRKKYPEAYVSISNQDPKIWALPEKTEHHLVIIGTQPHYTKEVCLEINESIKKSSPSRLPVILTVCPGITISQLHQWLPAETPIVRSMPNTPVEVRQGSTALVKNDFIKSDSMEEVKTVLSLTSPSIEILEQESHLDVAAAISGSAPAYVYYLMRSMVDAGVQKGLPESQAKSLVIQSMIGGAMLSRTSPSSFSELLSDVCVPGGSTEKAMAVLDKENADYAVKSAVYTCLQANIEMGN